MAPEKSPQWRQNPDRRQVDSDRRKTTLPGQYGKWKDVHVSGMDVIPDKCTFHWRL